MNNYNNNQDSKVTYPSGMSSSKRSVTKHYIVKKQDLPLSCPLPSMTSWNYHPKVYLPIEDTGEIKCPYCGNDFILDKSDNI